MFRPLFRAIIRSQDEFFGKLYNVIYKIMYIDLKFNEISLLFSVDSNHHSQCLKIIIIII